MRIGLATAPVPTSLSDSTETICGFIAQAANFDVHILCFPEAYLPGMRGQDFPVPLVEQDELREALEEIRGIAEEHRICVILPMEWPTPQGRFNLIQVISPEGTIMGRQCKTQLDPDEEDLYIPGRGRQIFELEGIRFGVSICHEGWRYPETVRWAACRGAKIIFHPQCTGSNTSGPQPTRWCEADSPYYEKAMICRAVENSVFFASVNYAFTYQASATSVIAPDGECLAHQPYGRPGLLVQQIELEEASGFYATRYSPDRY